MKIINSGTKAPRRKTKVLAEVTAPVDSQVAIQSADGDNTMSATAALGLISGSCDELGEKLSLAIAGKQFSSFEEQAAKLVADLFSIAVSAESLLEEMNPAPEPEGEDDE